MDTVRHLRAQFKSDKREAKVTPSISDLANKLVNIAILDASTNLSDVAKKPQSSKKIIGGSANCPIIIQTTRLPESPADPGLDIDLPEFEL